MKKILVVIISCLFFTSCYYDNASELFPAASLNANCDTTSVITYNGIIKNIFSNNCGTNNSCHSYSLAEGGVVLQDYNSALQVDTTTLVGSIEHVQGFIAMPPTSTLSECSIKQIKLWIQSGRPE
jgi:hypothetical protein